MGTDREPLEAAAPGTVACQICDLAGVISITTAAATWDLSLYLLLSLSLNSFFIAAHAYLCNWTASCTIILTLFMQHGSQR